MKQSKSFTTRQRQEDARIYKTITGFVYTQLALVLGAGAAMSL